MSRAWRHGSTRGWRKLRAYVLARDGYVCQRPQPDGSICGAPATQAGHIIPKSVVGGPGDRADNLRAECADCNESAGDGISRRRADAHASVVVVCGPPAGGKITPATVDYHRAQCSQEGGLERFAAFVAAAPAIGDPSGLDGKQAPAGATAMNAEQRQVMEMFGNTPEDIAKYGA